MSTISLGLAHLLLAYIVVVEPIWGARSYRRLKRDVADDSKDSGAARVRFYRLGIADGWAWVAVIALIVILGGPALSEIGLGPGTLGEQTLGNLNAEAIAGALGFALGLIVAVGLGVSVPLLAMWVKSRRAGGSGSDASKNFGDSVGEGLERFLAPVSAFLPYTKKERWLFAGICVTAGVCEEILFRGFLLFYLQEVFGSAPWVAIVVSSAIFGLCHVYQGFTGVLTTGVLGAVLAGLYLSSGSLLLPIIIHTLIDLRVLLLQRLASGRASSTVEG